MQEGKLFYWEYLPDHPKRLQHFLQLLCAGHATNAHHIKQNHILSAAVILLLLLLGFYAPEIPKIKSTSAALANKALELAGLEGVLAKRADKLDQDSSIFQENASATRLLLGNITCVQFGREQLARDAQAATEEMDLLALPIQAWVNKNSTRINKALQNLQPELTAVTAARNDLLSYHKKVQEKYDHLSRIALDSTAIHHFARNGPDYCSGADLSPIAWFKLHWKAQDVN